MTELPSVFVHIVTHNHAGFVSTAVESAEAQQGYVPGENLFITVTDNASNDGTREALATITRPGFTFVPLSENIGFCGAHNRGVKQFLDSACEYLLILNPDVRLRDDTLAAMVAAFGQGIGMVTPKLLRCSDTLAPLDPPIVDAAGMILTRDLRHFDRGAGRSDEDRFQEPCDVFGGTGACLIVSRACVEGLLLTTANERDTERVFPQLAADRSARSYLFDEAFFAYREDADLAWRAQALGWRVRYAPRAVAYHRRRVTPERRGELPPEINLHGVRNRFLLQLNNFAPLRSPGAALRGLLMRNLIVAGGVLAFERTSLAAFKQIALLSRRALERRREINRRKLESRLPSDPPERWLSMETAEAR